MSRPKCRRSVISLKSFFAVLESRLHKEFWLLIYPVKNLHFLHEVFICLYIWTNIMSMMMFETT